MTETTEPQYDHKALVDIFRKETEELQQGLQNMDIFYDQIASAADHMMEAFSKGHKVLIAGNGGSASQAQHLSDELVGRYKDERQPLGAVALTADGAVITCIGNDYGYEEVFSRQVAALGQEGDVFVGLSTSGNSKNVVKAAEIAREYGLTVIALTGSKGKLKELADYVIESPAESTARIQEFHLHAIHLLCEAFEEKNMSLFPGHEYGKKQD